jgi:hypothetical protein
VKKQTESVETRDGAVTKFFSDWLELKSSPVIGCLWKRLKLKNLLRASSCNQLHTGETLTKIHFLITHNFNSGDDSKKSYRTLEIGILEDSGYSNGYIELCQFTENGDVENAILFDMNKLFEKYVFLLFKKWEEEFQLSISGQTRFQFWENKEIKPDIVIDFKNSSGSRKRIIIDTKWKLLHSTPADSDLKQIYSYNLQLNAQQGILLYPKFNDNLESQKGFYAKSQIPILDNYSHSCDLYFIDLFNEQGKLDKDIGRQFLSEIKKA